MSTSLLASVRPETILSSSPMPELRRIVVEEHEDRIILTGRVSSFYLKQMAQESLRAVTSGRRLVNRLVVSQSN